jgi:hypothetical protein
MSSARVPHLTTSWCFSLGAVFLFVQRNDDAFITQSAIEGDRPILFNLECDIINKKKEKLIIAPAG